MYCEEDSLRAVQHEDLSISDSIVVWLSSKMGLSLRHRLQTQIRRLGFTVVRHLLEPDVNKNAAAWIKAPRPQSFSSNNGLKSRVRQEASHKFIINTQKNQM